VVTEATERMTLSPSRATMAGVTYEIKLNNGFNELLTETGAKTLQKT
jgi:hypothetical protein